MLLSTLVGGALVALASSATAQVLPAPGWGTGTDAYGDGRPAPIDCGAPRRCLRPISAAMSGPGAMGQPSDDGPGPELSFLLSAAVPGAGQYAQGRRRWLAYAAAEITGWFLVLDRRRDGSRLQDRYREIAWSAAREGLSEAPRTDGDFHYYETLSNWARSGRFDTESGTEGIQPETDPTTYNGSIWMLATGIFFPAEAPEPTPGDAIYEQAMDYYVERAYSDRFLWDWTEESEDWARYDETISESDDRFREATLFTGLIAANHLLSAVDAFVSARLGEVTGGALDVSTRVRPGFSGEVPGTRLDVSLTLRPTKR